MAKIVNSDSLQYLIQKIKSALSGFESRISSPFTFKGSCTFEELPTMRQEVGDFYNITNNFTLDGASYPAGSNVSWDGTSWQVVMSSSIKDIKVNGTSVVDGNGDANITVPSTTEIQSSLTSEVSRAQAKEAELQGALDENVANLKSAVGDAGVSSTAISISDTTWFNGGISGLTGELVETSPAIQSTDYVDVTGSETILLSGFVDTAVHDYGYAFYDSSKTFISGRKFDIDSSLSSRVQKDYFASIPSNAKYIRTTRVPSVNTSWNLVKSIGASLNSRLTDSIKEVATLNSAIGDFGFSQELLELLDIDTASGAILGTTGAIYATSPAITHTNYISVDGRDFVEFQGFVDTSVRNYGYAFYTDDYVTLKAEAFTVDTSLTERAKKVYTVEVPAGAKYFRTTIVTALNTDWYFKAWDGKTVKDVTDNIKDTIGDVQIRNVNLSLSDVAWVNGCIVGMDGRFEERTAAIKASDYISVEGLDTVTFQGYSENSSVIGYGYAFYSVGHVCVSSKMFDHIEGASSRTLKVYTVNVPAGAKYFRTTIVTALNTDWYLNGVGGSNLQSQIDKINKTSPLNRGPILVNPYRFSRWYKSQETDFLEGFTTSVGSPYYDELIQFYDSLLEGNSSYITKTSLGTASGTDRHGVAYSMYEYVLSTKSFTSGNLSKRRPKILIDAGIHGNERTAIFALYYLIKDIVLNYANDEVLCALHDEFEIHVLPVISCYGFDNGTYWNGNSVNINRNFPADNWEPTLTPPEQASGLEPLDQPESLIVSNWLKSNDDLFLHVTLHSSGTNMFPESNQLMVLKDAVDDYYLKMYNVNAYHIQRQTNVLPREFPFIQLGDTQTIGRITESFRPGILTKYAVEELNLLSINFEVSDHFKNSEGTWLGTYTETQKVCTEMLGNWIASVITEYCG